MHYDEDLALFWYICEVHSQMMSNFEHRANNAIVVREKASASSCPSFAQMLNETYGCPGDPEIATALAAGPDAFRRGVVRRILNERPQELIINRCPQCKRVVRTPQARQCFWCNHDWHEVGQKSCQVSRSQLSKPNPEDDDKAKLTNVGCVLTFLSVIIIFGVALPIVQWRDPATGLPLRRPIAILAPILIGAIFHGIATFLLRLIGLPVWSRGQKDLP
jgi:hypothetical protein